MITFDVHILDDGRVQARFEVTKANDNPEVSPWKYNDALVMSQDAWDAVSDADRQVAAQERFDNWYAVVTAPPADNPLPADGG
jgi:hypothetical protein